MDDLVYQPEETEELFYLQMEGEAGYLVGVAVCLVGVAVCPVDVAFWEYFQSLFPRSPSKKQPEKVHTYAVGM